MITARKLNRFLSIIGGVITGISTTAVFINANAISNQTLNANEGAQDNYMISLFVNIAITFAVGGLSLKLMLEDMEI